MKAFITLGISAAVCDVFYAPCTAMGKDPSGTLSLPLTRRVFSRSSV